MQINEAFGEVMCRDAVQTMPAVLPGPPALAQDAMGAVNHSTGQTLCADQVPVSGGNRGFAEVDVTDGATASGLDPYRENDIRSKILNGAYHSLAMADHVARAILRGGDL